LANHGDGESSVDREEMASSDLFIAYTMMMLTLKHIWKEGAREERK